MGERNGMQRGNHRRNDQTVIYEAIKEALEEGKREKRKKMVAEMVGHYRDTVRGLLSWRITLEEAMSLVPRTIANDVLSSLANPESS